MFGSIHIKARPVKMALLIDANNRPQLLAAIKMACSLWGGANFPIIPLYRRMPSHWGKYGQKPPSAEVWIKGYLSAFDVDFFVTFSNEVPEYIKTLPVKLLRADEVWNKHPRSGEYNNSVGLSLPCLLNNLFEQCFKYKPKYPTRVTIPKIPVAYAPFWSSVFGDFTEELKDLINAHYSEPLEISYPSVMIENFEDLMSGDTLFPRRLTTLNIESIGRGGSFGSNDYVFFMDASSISDIVDFWNLRATGRQVIPAPRQFASQQSLRKVAREFVIAGQRIQHGGNSWPVVPTFICSHNCDFSDMEAFAASLDIAPIAVEDRVAKYNLQQWYPRLWDEWARERDGGVFDQFSDEEREINLDSNSETEIRIDPLIPKFITDSYFNSEGVCVNEIDFRIYGAKDQLAQVYPADGGENVKRAISGLTSFDEWRVGRNGLTHVVHSRWSGRHKLHTSEEVLFAWLADKGWTAELSTSGLLAKQLYKKLSGTPLLIANQKLLGFLEYMSGGAVSREGKPIEGRHQDVERDVPVGEVKSRLDGKNPLSNRFNDFVQRGIFKLGLRAQCPTCQRSNWFGIDALGSRLDCPKCQTAFPAMGNIDKERANWHYRTSGPFSVPNFADGAYSVLLTMEALSGRSSMSVSATTVPSFTARSKSGKFLEADLAMIWREGFHRQQANGILFGECKSYGPFETKDVERMGHLGESFPGAILVFSTFRDSLTEPEIAKLAELARRGRARWKADHPINPVMVLTGRELFTWKGVPECWEPDVRERHRHVRGLIDIAMATQEVYLRMPSVFDDLHAEAETRKKNETKQNRRQSRKR